MGSPLSECSCYHAVVLREQKVACANWFELRVRKSESGLGSREEPVLSQLHKLPEGLPASRLCLALSSFQPTLPLHALASPHLAMPQGLCTYCPLRADCLN